MGSDKKSYSDDFNKNFKDLGGTPSKLKPLDFMKIAWSGKPKKIDHTLSRSPEITEKLAQIKDTGNALFRPPEIDKLLAQEKAEAKLTNLHLHLVDNLRSQGILERNIARATIKELSLKNSRMELKIKNKDSGSENQSRLDTTDNKEGKRINPKQELKKLRLAATEFTCSAWRSILEQSDDRKRTNIKSTRDQLTEATREVKTAIVPTVKFDEAEKEVYDKIRIDYHLYPLLPVKYEDTTRNVSGSEGTSVSEQERIETSSASTMEISPAEGAIHQGEAHSDENQTGPKYGSKNFEMPRFSQLTQKDIKDLSDRQQQDVTTTMNKFLQHYNELSKWRGLEHGLRAKASIQAIQYRELATEIMNLALEQDNLKRENKQKEVSGDLQDITTSPSVTPRNDAMSRKKDTILEEYRKGRIKEIGKKIKPKVIEMNAIEKKVKSINSKIIDIREHYNNLEKQPYANLMSELMKREKSTIGEEINKIILKSEQGKKWGVDGALPWTYNRIRNLIYDHQYKNNKTEEADKSQSDVTQGGDSNNTPSHIELDPQSQDKRECSPLSIRRLKNALQKRNWYKKMFIKAELINNNISKKNIYRENVDINKKSQEGTINEIEKIIIDIERMRVRKKGIIKEIASATTGKNEPNQDSSCISEYGGGVFDGVSQGGRGAEASKMAKEFFERELPKLSDTIKREKLLQNRIEGKLEEMILEIDYKINKEINKDIQQEDRKATTTLSAVIPIGDGKMTAVNVGDSRVYVLTKDGLLKHITTDDGPFENPDFYNDENNSLYQFTSELYNRMGKKKPDKQEQKIIQKLVAEMDDNQIREIKEKVELEEKVIDEKCRFDELRAKLRNEENIDKRYEIQNEIEKETQREIKSLSDSKSLEEMKIEFAIKCGNVIGQSLGIGEAKPNIVTFEINPGDRVIITSDGVHDNLMDQEIIDCISNSKTAEEAARALVKKSRERSRDQTYSRRKPDDTTAVVMETKQK